MNTQPSRNRRPGRVERPINRSSETMTHLRLVLPDPSQLPTPTDEEIAAATWECRAGEIGIYTPDDPELQKQGSLSFTYQGCGVMEPMNRLGRVRRRACQCELDAQKKWQKQKEMRDWMGPQARVTYGWLGESKSDMDLIEKTFENYDRSLQPIAYDGVREFVDILSGTLVLHGDYGTGKTHLLAALCNELRKRRIPSLFVTAPKLFQTIQGRIGRNESWEPLIAQAVRVPLLVIDDIDKAKWSEHREEVYFAIIDERAKAGKPIAISTNKLDKLADYVGGANASRLKIGQIEFALTGKDVREDL